MELNTKYHGVKRFEERDVIYFPCGIPGFDNLKKFILFPVEENKIFNVLHSIEDREIGLIVVSPFIIKDDYQFEIDECISKYLKIKEPKEVLTLTTVTLSSDVKKITTNLLAPIIININSKLGKQIILSGDNSLIKYPLFREEN